MNSLSLAVLWLLSEEPMHPYEMRQQISDRAIDHVVKVTHGALYHAVDRLARTGLIAALETQREGNRPERTVYTITDRGLDAAREQLRQMLSRIIPEYPSYRTALSFMKLLTPGQVAEDLGRRCVALEASLSGAHTVTESLTKQGLDRASLIEVEHMTALSRAELEWTRAVIDDIHEGRLRWDVRHES